MQQHNLPATVPDNDNRPATFDEAVIALIPRLKSMARKYKQDAQEIDDLVQDTIALGLKGWRGYDSANSLQGWLSFRMRHILQNKRRRKTIETTEYVDTATPCGGAQESAMEAKQLLELMPERSVPIIAALYNGSTLIECGVSMGVSESRVRAILKEDRTLLRSMAGMKEAA